MSVKRLYHHKTDGGAEYLCLSRVKGTKDEGDLFSTVVRLDGRPKLYTHHLEFGGVIDKLVKLSGLCDAEMETFADNEIYDDFAESVLEVLKANVILAARIEKEKQSNLNKFWDNEDDNILS